jgi:hypothetical protein
MPIVVPTPNTTINSVWGKSVADALNAMLVQSGRQVINTNATGRATIAYPVAFGGIPTFVAILSNYPGFVITSSTPATAANQEVIVITHAGVELINSAVSIAWIAHGPRA